MNWIGVLFFFSVLGYTLLLMLASREMKAGPALLSAVCAMLFVAYYGVIILGLMIPVAYVLIYGGLAGFAAGSVCMLLNIRNLRRRVLSPGMLVFALICIYCLWEAPFIIIQDHDSMSYWARAVKELYTFNRFYIHGNATMFHTDYIPLLASLQYCVVRVFGWQDAYPTFVTSVCIAASVAAMAGTFKKGWLSVIMGVLFVYAYRIFGFGLHDMRADGPMLMVFTAGLLILITRNDNDWVSLLAPVLVCSVLVGFKIYSGLMFAVVILIGFLIDWRGAAKQKRSCRSLAAASILSAILIITLQVSWSVLFNYATAAAKAESALLQTEYAGMTSSASDVSVSVSQLLSGNPRTAELMQSFTPEKMERFLMLADETLQAYTSSRLIWIWLFTLPAIMLCPAVSREKRKALIKTLLLLVLTFLIYLLGLFGSYFVQAETAGAALNYLSTASSPLLICSLFLTVWLAQDGLRAAATVAIAAMTGGMIVLASPAVLLPDLEKDEYKAEAALAVNFYEYDIPGLLTDEDYGKRALLLESSYQATEVNSKSGKTHAYAYFGLPVRVLEPVYYIYGDYTQLEDGFNGEWLRQHIINSRCDLLIVRVEDFLYWEEISDALELYGDYDDCIGVYDVIYEDGELSFEFRLSEEENWEE